MPNNSSNTAGFPPGRLGEEGGETVLRSGRAALLGLLPVILSAVVAFAAPGSAAAAGNPVTAIPGFLLTSETEPAPGVRHLELDRLTPPLIVHVAEISAGAPVSFRAVLSNEQVAGDAPRLERTSSMCVRVGCILGLNGDFANVDTSQPLGGLITDGQLLRSPSSKHHQLSINRGGGLSDQNLEWSGKLVPTDLRDQGIDGVNVDVVPDGVVLYTPAFASTTGEQPVTALVVRTVEPAGPMRLGQTTLLEITELKDGQSGVAIPPDGAVFAGVGQGADALRDLWARVQSGQAGSRALFRLETPAGVVESLGGSPILVRDGKRWYAEATDNFTVGRHPRTIVGWNAAGTTFLVTVDGRQPGKSVGMTLAEATQFMIDLGATDAINLDGGGSTTFVTSGGTVVNSPSDVAVKRGGQQVIRHLVEPGDKVVGHVERPVASALMVIPATTVEVKPADPLAGPSLDLPQALALPARASSDPGSVPDGSLPALVTEAAPDFSATLRVTAVAANVVVGVALIAYALQTRSRRGSGGPTPGSGELGWTTASVIAANPGMNGNSPRTPGTSTGSPRTRVVSAP